MGWESRKGWVGMQPLVGEGAQRREERKGNTQPEREKSREKMQDPTLAKKKKKDEDADTGKGRKGGQTLGREARKKNDMCGGSGGGRKGRRQRVTKGGEMEKTKG